MSMYSAEPLNYGFIMVLLTKQSSQPSHILGAFLAVSFLLPPCLTISGSWSTGLKSYRLYAWNIRKN